MKNNKIYLAGVLFAATAAFSACDDDFARPPMILPPTVNVEPTVSMPDFKQSVWGTLTSGPTTLGLDAKGDSIVFTGRVCSSDQSGNIYKNIVVQSHDDKGNQVAIAFSVNAYDLYQLFPFGQEVAVYATGMQVGPYRNLLQFGAVDGDQMTFMDEDVFKTHVVRNQSALPRPELVDTTAATIKHVNSIQSNSDSMQMWQSRLVCFKDVEWEEAGQKFAGNATANRYIRDAEGNRLLVRNSSYADFSDDIIPSGKGTVVGILSRFTSSLQLLLIDKESCMGFDGSTTPVDPDDPTPPSTDAETVFTSLGEDLAAMPEGWTIENVALGGMSNVWSWKTYDNKGYLNGSGYNAGAAAVTEAYAVSPVIDLTAYKTASVSFDHAAKFQTTLKTLCGICARTEGAKEWTKLDIPEWPASGAWKFVSSGDVKLDAFAGKKIQIAFKYASDATGADTWEIKNLTVKANK